MRRDYAVYYALVLDIDIGDTTRNLAATFDAADSEAEDDATGESALDPSGLCNHDGEVRQDENEHG
ncbi:hypothetical protein GN958_ATG15669 [Phytophthora infestans]|uniref:Uncharacterized protein n=1 Tax=Phytophthora infestans TaxID=4787 RepID=A0A8S9U766_PHYIN|nr:hypothetical protein GN958_ATG15669 [Phytophthora infestans]